MARSQKRSDAPERPITFHAAEDLGAFELAQLWADRTAWPIDQRTPYDELAELACMSALAKWLRRWQPIAIHSAMLAGAITEPIGGGSHPVRRCRDHLDRPLVGTPRGRVPGSILFWGLVLQPWRS